MQNYEVLQKHNTLSGTKAKLNFEKTKASIFHANSIRLRFQLHKIICVYPFTYSKKKEKKKLRAKKNTRPTELRTALFIFHFARFEPPQRPDETDLPYFVSLFSSYFLFSCCFLSDGSILGFLIVSKPVFWVTHGP